MGAKDWILMYSTMDIPSVLRAAPANDRAAAHALVHRLYPGRVVERIDDGNLAAANPPDNVVLVGCFPGLAVICTPDVALDYPSRLERRFLDAGKGQGVYLHAMHSVVDWFAFAFWDEDGTLIRSLSLSPDSGILENVGDPLPFEAAYWAGEHPVVEADDEDEPTPAYPLPFHPLEMAEDALRELFGFTYEGYVRDDDPDLEAIVLSGYLVHPLGS